ncbi:MAG: hypothetical protein Q9199_008048 [Rusavskia elegans]
MYTKPAALILGALAAMGSASPVASVAEARSVLNARDSAAANSTAVGKFHKLVTQPTPQAITHVFSPSSTASPIPSLPLAQMQALLAPSMSETSSFSPPSPLFITHPLPRRPSLLAQYARNTSIPFNLPTNTIRSDVGCQGASLGGIVRPGIFNLADFNFNDRASSYRCN